MIKSKWVFDQKKDVAGNVLRYKARLVAKGFTQVYDVDYKEIFAPVTKYETFRILIAFAAWSNYYRKLMSILHSCTENSTKKCSWSHLSYRTS